MLEIITDPNFWFLVGAYWIFNAAVSAMPKPKSRDGHAGYEWLYKFLHTLSGNMDRAFGDKIPGVQKEKQP